MHRCFVIFSFLLLGTNYLLPFNTIINLYDYYLNEKYLPISTQFYMTLINIVFQLTANITNCLVLFPILPISGREETASQFATSLSIALLFVLFIFAYIQLKGLLYIILSLLFAALLSISQSISDTTNMFIANKYAGQETVLAYASGINISGSIHSLIYICLSFLSHTNYRWLGSGYFFITSIILCSSLFVNYRLYKPIWRRAETGNQDGNLSTLKIILNIKWYFILLIINFSLTLSIFPSLALRNPTPLPNFKLFNAVFVFCFFNFSALCGNILAYMKPTKNIKLLYTVQFLRLTLCLPFFLLYQTNILIGYPSTTTLLFCLFIILTALSSGYTASCGFYSAPLISQSSNDKVVSLRLMNSAVSIGLAIGSIISCVLVNVIFASV